MTRNINSCRVSEGEVAFSYLVVLNCLRMYTKSVVSFRLSNGGCGEPFRNKRPIHHTRLNMLYRYNPMTYTNTGRSVIVVFLIRNCHIPIKDNAKTLSQNMCVDCSTLQKYKIFLHCTRRMKIISLGFLSGLEL